MTTPEKHRLAEIEDRIKTARHSLEALQPVYDQVHKRIRTLDEEIQRLEDERMKIQHGQLSMHFDDMSF